MKSEPEIDDILAQLKGSRKKRINSSRKGKRGERDLCRILSERFGLPFAKRPDEFGSGGWSTTHETVQEGLDLDHMAGDILTPKGFRFCIENKLGYDLEILNLLPGANRKRDRTLLDSFVAQAERDSARVGKEPLVIYKKDRCPHLAGIPKKILPNHNLVPFLEYNGYLWFSLDSLLTLPDDFFFPPHP